MPWMPSLCRMCWRRRPIAVCATVSASAALMPNSGQADACAHLPVERPRAGARHERRREASDTALDGEAGGVEGFGAPGGGALLLEGQLGMGVDAVAQRDQAVPARGDPLADGGSGIHGDLRLQLPEGGAQRQGWGRGPFAFVRLQWYSGARPVS